MELVVNGHAVEKKEIAADGKLNDLSFDYTPQAVKMAVCGTGAAAKKQVQRMVGTILRLPDPPESDHAADALAVAICHAAHAATARAVADQLSKAGSA